MFEITHNNLDNFMFKDQLNSNNGFSGFHLQMFVILFGTVAFAREGNLRNIFEARS